MLTPKTIFRGGFASSIGWGGLMASGNIKAEAAIELHSVAQLAPAGPCNIHRRSIRNCSRESHNHPESHWQVKTIMHETMCGSTGQTVRQFHIQVSLSLRQNEQTSAASVQRALRLLKGSTAEEMMLPCIQGNQSAAAKSSTP
eukprot:1322308-Amphidinium_carterae.2